MSNFLTADTKAFWKLDEASGTRFDIVNDHDLTDNNTVTRLVGVVGSGAQFVRANQEYLEISDDPDLEMGNRDFTCAFWFNIQSTNIMTAVNKSSLPSDAAWGVQYRSDLGRMRLFLFSDGTISTLALVETSNVTENSWHFCLAEHDSVNDEIRIAVDNESPSGVAHSAGVFDSSVSFRVGTDHDNPATRSWDGGLDAVGIWHRILTDEEKTELYNSGFGREYPFFTDKSPSHIGGFMLAIDPPPVSGLLGGYIEGGAHPGPTGTIGGFMFSKIPVGNELATTHGGLMLAAAGGETTDSVGGFMLSIPLVDIGPFQIGGFTSGLFQKGPDFVGGYMFGRPQYSEFVATRARTLAAVTSELVADHGLNVDATIVFKQIGQDDINAQVINEKTFQDDIHAKVEVQKFKLPPCAFIQDIQIQASPSEPLPSGDPMPNFDPSGIRTVSVTASGLLRDGERFVSAQIDFGDPFNNTGIGFKPSQSISGFTGPPPWTSSHDYDMSGLYIITVRTQDDLGMVGMTCSGLNLASGATAGIHFPLVSISGTPRMGEVPPNLQVNFTSTTSGIQSPPFTAAQRAASLIQSPTDERILWNLGNREKSVRKNPVTYYQSPGDYLPALRFLYTNPSGSTPGFGVDGRFMISDTLQIGFNR